MHRKKKNGEAKLRGELECQKCLLRPLADMRGWTGIFVKVCLAGSDNGG